MRPAIAIQQAQARRGKTSKTADFAWENYSTPRGVEALGTAGIFVVVGIVLPWIVHSLNLPPRILLPMHYPIFLAGLMLSPLYAVLVGVLAPALSTGFSGFPTSSQVMRMIPELAVYAGVTSLVFRSFPVWKALPKVAGRYAAMMAAMLAAMIAGRLVYVLMYGLLSGGQEFAFFAMIIITPAIPGMIAQLLLVPAIAYRLHNSLAKK